MTMPKGDKQMMKMLKWSCPNERKYPKDCERAREKSTRDIFDAISEW